jgi:dTDP-4-dehydrorhamnose reductase
MQREFWAGRRVLVTGHTGFKGTWLSLWLQQLGAEVSGLSRSAPAAGGFFDAVGLRGAVASSAGDLTDAAGVARAVAAARPEVVVHLAAQPLVRAAREDPAATFAANVVGTTHLLDAVRAAGGVRAVLCVTTDKVYAPPASAWPHREDDPLGGHDPYSTSKACAELVVAAYRRSFLAEAGTHVATARTGNLVGGGDRGADRLVPDLLRAATSGEPVHLRSPAASGRGCTSSTRCTATSCCSSGCGTTPPPPARGTSAPTPPTCAASAGSPIGCVSCGVTTCAGPAARTAPPTRSSCRTCASTPRWPASGSAGPRAGISTPRWPASSTSPAPATRAPRRSSSSTRSPPGQAAERARSRSVSAEVSSTGIARSATSTPR